MKKTLTVNLGGTVFNIDDDAYRLLDNYLSNLRLHFRKEAGADEIVDDIERRISELFTENLSSGAQVITITEVEEVIARMGRPEEMEPESGDAGETADAGSENNAGGGYGAGAWNDNGSEGTIRRRLYRNPDDKMLGGVVGGLAAFLNCNATAIRLFLLLLLLLGTKLLILTYIICWLIIPEAHTAAEKLSMRGEAVTLENIGKTVTDGFERATDGVNAYIHSEKPRSLLQKLGDALVMIVGWGLKVGLVVFAIVCSPFLFVLGVAFVALLFAVTGVRERGFTYTMEI